MMKSVIECIKSRHNGLIESPTGTGKTMAILCSAIATLQYMRKNQKRFSRKLRAKLPPKSDGAVSLESGDEEDDEVQLDLPSRIIYCTRTHSQINQIFEEMKSKLPYVLRVSPFASRKHSCIFENLPEQFPGNALNLSCKLLRKLNLIQSKLNKDATLKLKKFKDPQIKDIEDTTSDAVEVNVIKSGCPFFYGYAFEKKSDGSSQSNNQFGALSLCSKPDKTINYVASQIPWDQPLSVNDYNKIGRINNSFQECDLAIIPYNYIVDKNLRSQVNIPLKDSILIFDEGHNIDSFCEELLTFEISINDLFQVYQQLNQIWLDLQAEEQLLSEYQRYQVKGQRVDTKALCIFVLKIIDVLESYNLERPDNKININNIPNNMNVYRLPELFSLIAMVFGKLKDEKDMMMERMKRNRIQVNEGQMCKLNDDNGVIDQEFTFIEKLEMFITILQKCIVESGEKAKSLNKFYDSLLKIKLSYLHYQKQLVSNGTSHVTEDPRSGYYDFYVCISDDFVGPQQRRKIAMWCFNPSFAFQSLLEEKPRCVIFTSGTLAPLHTYQSELETSFHIRLENDHVIDKNNQVLVGVLTNDLEDNKIVFSFDKREDYSFYVAFARTLQRIFAKISKGGILVFLPSYTVLKKVHKVWRQHRLYKELFQDREIFIEPQDQVKNSILFQDYKKAIAAKGRAVFIAVCRGKLSEGIDFTDNVARCVIMAGIPYPQIYDPKVVTKKDYLDRKYAKQKSQINGNMWYKLQACRAINQAIGRVIRHVNDFGAIILMDERYKTHNIEISKWLNTKKRVYSYFPELESDLENFFAKNGCPVELPPTSDQQISSKRHKKRSSKTNKNLIIENKTTSPTSMTIQYEYEVPNTESPITKEAVNNSNNDSSPQKSEDSSNNSSVSKQLLDSGSLQINNEGNAYRTFNSGLESFQKSVGSNKFLTDGARLYREDHDQGEFFAEQLNFAGETFGKSIGDMNDKKSEQEVSNIQSGKSSKKSKKTPFKNDDDDDIVNDNDTLKQYKRQPYKRRKLNQIKAVGGSVSANKDGDNS